MPDQLLSAGRARMIGASLVRLKSELPLTACSISRDSLARRIQELTDELHSDAAQAFANAQES